MFVLEIICVCEVTDISMIQNTRFNQRV